MALDTDTHLHCPICRVPFPIDTPNHLEIGEGLPCIRCQEKGHTHNWPEAYVSEEDKDEEMERFHLQGIVNPSGPTNWVEELLNRKDGNKSDQADAALYAWRTLTK